MLRQGQIAKAAIERINPEDAGGVGQSVRIKNALLQMWLYLQLVEREAEEAGIDANMAKNRFPH